MTAADPSISEAFDTQALLDWDGPTFEYCVRVFSPPSETIPGMNAFGKLGWEVVSVFPIQAQICVYFKRLLPRAPMPLPNGVHH